MTLEERATKLFGDWASEYNRADKLTMADQQGFMELAVDSFLQVEADTEKRVREQFKDVKEYCQWNEAEARKEWEAEQCVEWLRGNVKMRTVDDVRAEIDGQIKDQFLEIDMLKRTIVNDQTQIETMRAKAQVLVDALEEIDLRTPSDGTLTLPIAIKIAREALEKWRGK